MQLNSYLPLYLLLNQKVELKDIGTIILKKINGFHEHDTNTLYPPTVHLVFDENYTLNNNFANFISEQESINVSEANLKLDRWLQNIKTKLENSDSYFLDKIGFFKSQNQKILFTSANDAYFNQANFGFKEQKNIVLNDDAFINYIEDEVNITPEQKVFELKPVIKEADPVVNLQLDFEQPVIPAYLPPSPEIKPKKNIEQEKKIKQKKDWFWIIAIIIVCLTGAMVCATFIYFPPFKPIFLETQLKQNRKANIKLETLETPVDTVQTYNIIIAENLTPLKAQKQLLKLKAKGIFGSLITNDSTIIVEISAATYLNLDSAQAKLKQIQNKFYPKAYLKTIKSTN